MTRKGAGGAKSRSRLGRQRDLVAPEGSEPGTAIWSHPRAVSLAPGPCRGDEVQGEAEPGPRAPERRRGGDLPWESWEATGLRGGAACSLSVSSRGRVGCHGRRDLSGQGREQRGERSALVSGRDGEEGAIGQRHLLHELLLE